MAELLNAFGHLDSNTQCSVIVIVFIVTLGITEAIKIIKN